MKSIFKKIAFVLALAMVVTMLPAKAVTAAESDGPQMYKTLLLYLDSGNGEGSDITGSFKNERYASVWGWREGGYDRPTFVSSNPEVATVNGSGKVTAVKVGKTTITATFTGDGLDTVVKECAVTVKRNANRVGLSSESAKQVEAGFTAGDKVQLTAVRKDAEGNTEWNKTMRDFTTDSVRFKSSNESVFTVTKTTGMLTAVGEGEATLTIWAVQSEGYDANAKEYPAGASKEYTVKVSGAGLLSVKQLSTDTVAITCGNADTAAEIAKDIAKLDVQYMLGENPIKTYVKSAAVDGADNKVVNVTLFSAMNKDVVYKFTYKETTVELTAVDPDAIASIRIVTTQAKVQEETEIRVEFLDANGVVINPGTNALTFSAEGSSDYSLYPVGNKGYIYFFEAGKTAHVTATYDMGWDEKGNKLPDKTASATIVSKVASDADNMVGYAADAIGKKASDLTYTTGVLNVVKDEAIQLYAKYTVKNFDGSTSTFFNVSSDGGQVEAGNFYFKYVSTNDAVVLVDELSGVMYPVANNGGTAQVIIYRVVNDKEVVVGAVTVKVEGSRTFTSIDVSLDKTKLSDNGTTGETARITVEAKDQLGQSLSKDLTYRAKVTGNTDNVTLTVGGMGLSTDYRDIAPVLNDDGTVKVDNGKIFFDVQVDISVEQPRNLQISIEAKQPGSGVTKVLGRSLMVKKPTGVASYSLDLSQTSINVNLIQASSWWSNLNSSIQLNSYDNQGFYIATIPMTNTATPAIDSFGYVVTKGNVNIPIIDSQNFWAVTGVATVSGSAVSGSAITFKVEGTNENSVGTYTVKVFKGVKGGSGVQQIAVKSIVVTDTTVKPTATVSNNKVSGTAESIVVADLSAKLADGSLTIRRGNDKINDNITIVGAKRQDRPQNDRVYVESIHVVETIRGGKYDGKTFEYDIPVGQVFYTN